MEQFKICEKDTKTKAYSWLKIAVADAERRGLPELKPLLEGLARATKALRAARFGGQADGPTDH